MGTGQTTLVYLEQAEVTCTALASYILTSQQAGLSEPTEENNPERIILIYCVSNEKFRFEY